MELINADYFYRRHMDDVSWYLLAVEAKPVEAGYKVGETFYNAAAFETRFEPTPRINEMFLPEVPKGSKLNQVRTGDVMSIEGTLHLAETDGFILKLPRGETTYYADSVFRSMYRVNAPKRADGGFLVVEKEAPILHGIILKKDTIFDFTNGPHKVSAGGILFENPQDEDGYTACPASSSFGTFLNVYLFMRPGAVYCETPG